MLVADVISILEGIAPLELAEDWDNVGLLCGESKSLVSKILVALDCTQDPVEKAVKENCNLIVTHHPVIFKSLKRIDYTSALAAAVKNNISIYAMHTNMDNSERSMNYYIATKLNAKNIQRNETGILFEVEALSIKNLADTLKSILGDEPYKIKGNLKDKVNKIFLCTGSGINDSTFAFCKQNVDICISSEIKHNFFAESCDLKIIEFSHFNSELPFEQIICDILKDSGVNSIKNKTKKPYFEY